MCNPTSVAEQVVPNPRTPSKVKNILTEMKKHAHKKKEPEQKKHAQKNKESEMKK